MNLIQTIDTNNLSENYSNILESVCNTLYNFLIINNANNEINCSNNLLLTINYKIKRKNIKKKNIFKNLEKYKRINKNDELIINNNICIICHNKYKIGEYKRNLHYCNHIFHRKCIDKWLFRSKNMDCPLCRTTYYDILLQ